MEADMNLSINHPKPSTPPETRHDTGAVSMWQVVKQTVADWSEDKAPRLGAALAYYAVFSLAPMLILALAVAGLFFERGEVEAQLNSQFEQLLGPEGAEAVETLVAGAQKPAEGFVAAVIGAIALAFGATGVFVQLKDAMNTIWEVRVKKGQGVWGFVRTYFLSFAMVLGIGFLLVVLLVASALLSAATGWLDSRVPIAPVLIHLPQLVGTFLIVALLFAMIFKLLPDVQIAWKDVWLGAVVTSLLFSLGKSAIGLYLGRASFGSSYGAAGTVLIVLAWTYYSAQILFLGAEFTQVYARYYGTRIRPADTAEQAGNHAGQA
jgi:membrane protein